jgi:hypothetical protein
MIPVDERSVIVDEASEKIKLEGLSILNQDLNPYKKCVLG